MDGIDFNAGRVGAGYPAAPGAGEVVEGQGVERGALGDAGRIGAAENLTAAPGVRGTPQVGDSSAVDIDPPQAAAGAVDVSELVASLDLNDDAMFELYGILQLLQDCANKQRAAAREARQAEYASQKAAILRQADEMMTAAVVGLVTGIAGSALTLASLVTSVKGVSSATATKMKLIKDSRLPDASKTLSAAHSDVARSAKALDKFKAGLRAETGADAAPGAAKPPAGRKAAGPREAPGDLGGLKREDLTPEQRQEWDGLKARYQKDADRLGAAQKDYDQALSDLHDSPDFIKAEKDMSKAQGWQMAGQLFGGLFNSLSQSLNQLLSTGATVEHAGEVEAEQESQQQNDMLQTAGDVRQKVLELLSAIIQVDNESLKKIINA